MTQKGVWDLQDVRDEYLAGNWTYISATAHNVFVIGEQTDGQLGLNDRASRSSPVQLPGAWSHIEWGKRFGLGVKSDATLWAWGENDYGSLGQNAVIDYSSPVQIPGTTWASAGAVHNQAAAGIKSDGTLWMWGWNSYGEQGLNDRVARSSPTQIPGTQWNKVAAGAQRIFASKTDGTLWAWGISASGTLGLNDNANRSSPTQIPGTYWDLDSVSSSNYCGDIMACMKTDGTLWGWGNGYYGGVGWNNQISYSSPIQIPGTQWGYVAIGNGHWVATKTDGTMWTSGYVAQGQGGYNSTVLYSSPRQIPGTQWGYGKYSLAAGRQHSTAVKTDGTMWTWGKNNQGQINTNDKTNRSSPTQIPGTQWSQVSSGTYINAGYIPQ